MAEQTDTPFPAPGVGGTLSDDWAAIWQSELAALATDREWQEGMRLAADGWAKLAVAAHDGPPGRPGPDAAQGAAPADAAPGPGDAELGRLRARVAELERAARRT